MSKQLFEVTSLCMNTGIESLSPLITSVYCTLVEATGLCHSLPRPVLAFDRLVLHHSLNAVINWSNDQAVGWSHVRSNDLRHATSQQLHCSTCNEPVHYPAERCKLHRQCFGWLAVTPSVNEKVNLLYLFIYIQSEKCFCHSECEHLEAQACCKLLEYDLQTSQGNVLTVLRRGGQNYEHL